MYYDDPGSHPNFVALREALTKHPLLCEECEKHSTFEEVIAEIAAYCNILLDGAYTNDEIFKLVGILAEKLNGQSTLIIPVGFDPKKPVEYNHEQTKEIEIFNQEVAEVSAAIDWAADLGVDETTGSPDITELTGSSQDPEPES